MHIFHSSKAHWCVYVYMCVCAHAHMCAYDKASTEDRDPIFMGHYLEDGGHMSIQPLSTRVQFKDRFRGETKGCDKWIRPRGLS